MCGIVGFQGNIGNILEQESIIKLMMGSINHRGPDGSGSWIDPEQNITLGHQRLSIIDLSKGGHQPMESKNGRFIISYNGEIYNFHKIKKELEELDINFLSSSDTEVLIESFSHWGIEATLKKLEGMFAIALWDKKNKNLYLIRDRLGEKPLYYGLQNNIFFFSSELKALKYLVKFKKKVSRKSIDTFLHFGYFLNNETIYDDVFQVPAATYLVIPIINKKISSYDSIKINKYWHIQNNKSINNNNLENNSLKLEDLLRKKINDQMISDVPLGAFLSGGIDSSLIVALMQEQSIKKINTFTIGFTDSHFDESSSAKEIASYLGTDHNELILSESDLLKLAKNNSNIYDQPFGDLSALPTKLLTDFTKSQVTVALSGDAGDELFCGYERYKIFNKFYNVRFREYISKFVSWLPANRIENFFSRFPIDSFHYITAQRIMKFEKMLGKDKNSKGNYLSLFMSESEQVNKIFEFTPSIDDYLKLNEDFSCNSNDYMRNIMHHDLENYFPEDILVKVDRAAMSSSLETRMPFLNHEVIEFSQELPFDHMYSQKHEMKVILKKILSKKIPKNLFNRPKQGFSVPIVKWLKNDLRDWMHDSLSPKQLEKTGFFNSKEILNLIDNFATEKESGHVQLIWNVLMLQNWAIDNNHEIS